MTNNSFLSRTYAEFQDAIEWITAALEVGERALARETSLETREEWADALEAKRQLLMHLEHAQYSSAERGPRSWY